MQIEMRIKEALNVKYFLKSVDCGFVSFQLPISFAKALKVAEYFEKRGLDVVFVLIFHVLHYKLLLCLA